MVPRGLHRALPADPRIVFTGTPDFAVPCLDALVSGGYNVISVVTQPDRPRGRGKKLTPPPVKALAEEKGIAVIQPERLDEEFLRNISALKPDIFVVIAFGQIIPGRVLELSAWGGINVHASLLPKYRGSAPIQWAVINNEKTTGLTTMCMDEGLDTGPILLQKEVPIANGETAGELHDRLSFIAPEILMDTLRGMSRGKIEKIQQEHSLATYAPKLKKDQGRIAWNLPAEKIHGLILGLDPWPGAFTYYEGKLIKLFRSLLAEGEEPSSAPGSVMEITKRGVEVRAGKGSVIIREVQLAGRNRIPAEEFSRGSGLKRGAVLG